MVAAAANRAAAATGGRGRCELPAILRATPKIARLRFLWAPCDFCNGMVVSPPRSRRRGHYDFGMRALCRSGFEQIFERNWKKQKKNLNSET